MEIRYHLEGFLDARVVFVGVSFDDDRRRASLRYRVHEGTRYKISELKIEYGDQPGDLPHEQDRRFLGIKVLGELTVVRAGDPFRREDLDRGKRLVKERLWARSYALMQMQEVIFPDPENHTVKITLRLRAGHKVRMGRQRFQGNIYTRDKVLRRAFRYGARPGEPLDAKELDVGMNRLRSLRFFSLVRLPNVTGLNPFGLLSANDPQNPDVYDVEIEVQEADTREFNIGGALSTDGGLIGTFDLRYRNFDITKPPSRPLGIFDPDAFRGAGQEFIISFRPGTTFSSFELTFREPSVRDSLWSFGSSVFQRLALYDTWDQNTTGIIANVGRFLDKRQRWSMAFDWALREVVVSDLEPNAPQGAFDAQGHTAIHSLGWRLSYDVRESFGRTITGHRTTLGLTLSGGILGGEVDTFRVDVAHRRGIKLWRTKSGDWWRLTLRGHAGLIAPFSDTAEVPIYERYFTGGRPLRGFEFRGVGPRSNGSPEGGDWLLTLQMELIMPVSHNPRGGPGIDFVLFMDQGTLTTDFDAFIDDPMWRLTVGLGIGVSLTPGQPPFRFDFGFALLAEDQDDKEVFSFSIQRQF